ncbi:hypothetical protein E2C01_049745 [Portunus trituberculatus]|uniref:Uncharacterized protein n=1 Tax=Portunus trituberculatus TaxID=210409 RepID=A0A5B7G776_PORTR|nr:hypothetical protein [Portunus trituberculatus]
MCLACRAVGGAAIEYFMLFDMDRPVLRLRGSPVLQLGTLQAWLHESTVRLNWGISIPRLSPGIEHKITQLIIYTPLEMLAGWLGGVRLRDGGEQVRAGVMWFHLHLINPSVL